MVTISLELPDELVKRLMPLQNRLPEIIELGLRQLEVRVKEDVEANHTTLKRQVLAALHSTGIVTLPEPAVLPQIRIRHTPIKASGPSASEMIIEARRGKL